MQIKREAEFYEKLNSKRVQCKLCHHQCIIDNNKIGVCGVRKNTDGILYAETYGKFCSAALDPIEKKPLYHFYPGSSILSFGSIGCNLKCFFCQNFEISQTNILEENINFLRTYQPEKIIELCKQNNTNLVSFTYNEPLIMYEYLIDCVPELKKNHIKSVLVTNGSINKDAATELAKLINAANIDLKAFTEEFYKKNCKGSLSYVMKFIEIFYEMKVHIELTCLVIPTLNDDINEIKKMVDWIAELDKNIPLHFSRYFPRYKASQPPTDEKLLIKIYEIAKNKLQYVYLGNVGLAKYSSTYCPNCNFELITRNYYYITNKMLLDKCPNCNYKLPYFVV